MLRTCFAIVIAGLALASDTLAQQAIDKATATCSYSELYREEGWVIPGLEGAKEKTGRAAVPDTRGVYLTTLEPAKRVSTIEVFRCSQEHAGRLEIKSITMGIEDLYAFDVRGRIFAYSLAYGVDGIAASWYVMFYDLDGSGRFALRRSERSRLVPDLIPEWVKDHTHARAKEDGSQVVPSD